MALTADELLAGGDVRHEVDVPTEFVDTVGQVVIRPLTVRDLQRIGRAARDDDELSAVLMVQQAMVEPALTAEQVQRLPAGLARFLVERINVVSGVGIPRDRMAELVQEPLARACFLLAKDFGWTPEDVAAMTVGQVLMYLEMAHADGVRP